MFHHSVNLELFKTSDAMASPVHVLHCKESVSTIAQLLLDTTHGGFPVVRFGSGLHTNQFIGLITRYNFLNKVYFSFNFLDRENSNQ